MKLLSLLLVAAGGAALTLQIAWNARLRVATGSPILTVLISLCVSLLVVSALWAAGIFPRGGLSKLGGVPVWGWLGGLCAAFYLLVSLTAIPRHGAAIVVSLVVAGQMAAALFLDATGAFGVQPAPLGLARLAGAGLIIAGVALIQHK